MKNIAKIGNTVQLVIEGKGAVCSRAELVEAIEHLCSRAFTLSQKLDECKAATDDALALLTTER